MRGKVRDRILRVLANNPSGDMSKYEIARQAGATYPWVREFFSKLEEMGLLKSTTVLDYPALLRYWQSVYIKHKYREYMVKEPLKLLKDIKLPYALTTYQAENLIQSYLFPSRVDIYIKEGDWKQWHDMISKKGLVGKGNLRLLLAEEHVLYKSFEKDGLKIVSTPQLIVDLMIEGGVCVEAAELLIEKVMKNV
ncbi:MAG: helix-turn-helix domain-containing protein (plasmid) [Candidatus Methanoperedens sp.]|nr:MAG: helix-turn-helix domain-containing protein [Candidatus Methanoperedens sp.]